MPDENAQPGSGESVGSADTPNENCAPASDDVVSASMTEDVQVDESAMIGTTDAEAVDDAKANDGKNKRSLSIVAGLLVALLAFAITVQVRNDDNAQDFSNVRGVELAEMLKSIDATNQRLAAQIQDLTATRDQLKADSTNTAKAEKTARERADAMAILAGSAGAKGPGIQITVTAPDESITASVLLDAVQEMRDAGAEAIVINGVARVVAHTWFADDSTGVRVGGRILQPPFVIEVIGDPHTLEKAVNFRGGLADRVQGRGGNVDVIRRDTISITALADEVQGQYARPAQ